MQGNWVVSMTKYVDLHLCAPLNDVEKAKKMIAKSSEMGYGAVGIPLSSNVGSIDVEHLRKICNDAGLDFVTRIDLTPRNPGELLSSLRRFRRKFEVISVKCNSKPVARQAAKDHRVDLFSFSGAQPANRFFDAAQAELASASSASLEIDMSLLLSLEGFLRIRLLSSLRRETALAKGFRVPVVFSSGASDESLLRRPRDYLALATLFDLDASVAAKAFSENPSSLVQRNRLKLSPDFVAPGLRVVRRRDP
jgi:RNase P/RNase MRP subunit p30